MSTGRAARPCSRSLGVWTPLGLFSQGALGGLSETWSMKTPGWCLAPLLTMNICYSLWSRTLHHVVFKTGRVEGGAFLFRWCHCPVTLSHTLACVYLIDSLRLSPSSSFPLSLPHKSCLTNSGQGQFFWTERLLPVLDCIFQSRQASQVVPAKLRRTPMHSPCSLNS